MCSAGSGSRPRLHLRNGCCVAALSDRRAGRHGHVARGTATWPHVPPLFSDTAKDRAVSGGGADLPLAALLGAADAEAAAWVKVKAHKPRVGPPCVVQ